MNDLRISVAMCTYNGSRFVQEQLQSISSQTVAPLELIVCDDNSTDATPRILQEFAEHAPFPVRIYSNEVRLGPAQNFARAIGLCKGEIIALSDQDDVWKPEKLAVLSGVLENTPEAAYAFSDAEMIDEGGALLGLTFWDAVEIRPKLQRFSGPGQLDALLRHNLVSGATMAFRASFRDVVLPIPEGWMHDYWIVLLGSAVSSGVPVGQTLFQYRRHAAQVCGWRKHSYLDELTKSFNTDPQDSWKKLETFRNIEQRLQAVSGARTCPAECLHLLRDKEKHLQVRAEIRCSKGLSKFGMWLSEAFSGRYKRFSDSWQSMVRDLS
jgi:glycosyltransferase involved in cell wall biosynthesis